MSKVFTLVYRPEKTLYLDIFHAVKTTTSILEKKKLRKRIVKENLSSGRRKIRSLLPAARKILNN